jgi:iron complex transport system ATP-binding protein
LQATDTHGFAHRTITHLSGGERQRVVLAQAVAQQTPLIVLDEPTAHLDLVHQLDMLTLVKNLVCQGRGAFIALHDLTLAVRFCDRVLVLVQGHIVADGQPAEVITTEHLASYFGVHARVWSDPESGGLIVLPLAPLGRP